MANEGFEQFRVRACIGAAFLPSLPAPNFLTDAPRMLDRQSRCRFNRMEDCPLLIDQSLTSIRLGKLVPQTPACSEVRLPPRELPNNPQARPRISLHPVQY